MKRTTPDPEARAYFEEVLSLRPNGKPQRKARCPFHEDRRPSLSVNLDTGLWTCFADSGCGNGNRKEFERRLAMMNAPVHEPSAKPNGKTGWEAVTQKFVATYEYTDAAGNKLFRKGRKPGPDKDFSTERWDGQQWASGLTGVAARPLYNLPAVRAAKKIVLCEGEKDADRVHEVLRKAKRKDWAATTNFDGAAGAFRPEYAEALARKEVIILPDNDDAGRQHAEIFARGAAAVASNVKVLALPDLPEKCDVSDYLDAHADKEFLSLLGKAPPWEDQFQKLFMTAPEFAARTPEATPWVVTDLLAAGSATILAADIKAGKSTFTHYLLRSVLGGEPFLERATLKSPAVYLTEMPENDLRAQLRQCRGLLECSDLHLLPFYSTLSFDWPEVAAGAIAKCKSVGASVLVVDTFTRWSRNENENDASKTFAAWAPLDPALAAGLALLVEVHDRKAGGDITVSQRGSNSLPGNASILLGLRFSGKNHPSTFRDIVCLSRYGGFTNTIELTPTDYVFKGSTTAVVTEQLTKKVFDVLPGKESEALTVKELAAKTGNPKTSTLKDVLNSGLSHGMIRVCGKGVKGKGKRYWAPFRDDAPKKPKY
jgi:hypothetical protein